MSADNSTVLGVVVFARHGDRQGFYQDPQTYTASATVITPLGEVSINAYWRVSFSFAGTVSSAIAARDMHAKRIYRGGQEEKRRGGTGAHTEISAPVAPSSAAP